MYNLVTFIVDKRLVGRESISSGRFIRTITFTSCWDIRFITGVNSDLLNVSLGGETSIKNFSGSKSENLPTLTSYWRIFFGSNDDSTWRLSRATSDSFRRSVDTCSGASRRDVNSCLVQVVNVLRNIFLRTSGTGLVFGTFSNESSGATSST